MEGFYWLQIFKLMRVESLLLLASFGCLGWGKLVAQGQEFGPLTKRIFDSFLGFLLLLAWMQSQSPESLSAWGILNLTDLQCESRLFILIYGLGYLRFVFQISSYQAMGLYFLLLGLFCASLTLVGGKAEPLVLGLACLPLFFFGTPSHSARRKTVILALILIPGFSILGFLPVETRLGLLLRVLPPVLSLCLGSWIISFYPHAKAKGQEAWYLLFQGYLLFLGTLCFCLFVQTQSLPSLNHDLAVILQIILFWILCVNGFQTLILPKVNLHGFSSLIPLAFLLLFFCQSPTDPFFAFLVQMALPLLFLHLYLLENRAACDPLETRILALQLSVLCLALPLQGLEGILSSKINASLGILAVISTLSGLALRWNIRFNQKVTWKSSLVLFWVLSLGLMPAFQKTGLKLDQQIKIDYKKKILILETTSLLPSTPNTTSYSC
jgi:hypothetical protein